MSTEQSKSLVEQRAELEKQLRSLTDRRDGLYWPGITLVSDQPRSADEQTALQIEELQAAIAQIDEALNNPSGNS
jgi:transposase